MKRTIKENKIAVHLLYELPVQTPDCKIARDARPGQSVHRQNRP
jgi:hypothetical protein